MSEKYIEEIISLLPQRLSCEKTKKFNGIIHLVLSGKIKYSISIENCKCIINEGIQGTAFCNIACSTKTFIDIITARIKPEFAIMSDKLKSDKKPFAKRFFYSFQKITLQELNANKISQHPKGILSGLRILDFSRLLPGPLATLFMADMGAEVIKIEHPTFHDSIRDYPPFIGEDAINYDALNRSKKSFVIDYTCPDGLKIIEKLVLKSDILIEQFRPGQMAQYKLDYNSLKKINPKLIYVSLTGYGQSGPYSQKAGHDLNFLAISGLLGMTGSPEKPSIPIAQVADIAGGSYPAVVGCLAALWSLQKTGKGQHIDVSMLDGVMPLMTFPITDSLSLNNRFERSEYLLSGMLPNYNVYECSDGKFIALAAIETKFWERFCVMAGKPEWRSILYSENSKVLKNKLSLLFKEKKRNEWVEMAKNIDMCLSPVLELHELENDPQLQHRQMIIESQTNKGTKFKTVGFPIKFSDYSAPLISVAPTISQHTEALLKELKISKPKIEELRKNGVIK